MGCPSFVIIGKTLTFSIATHDPDTGVLTDASAVPDYWVYEDETGVSINANTPPTISFFISSPILPYYCGSRNNYQVKISAEEYANLQALR